MSPLEYHVLLALLPGPLYGYAIRQAVHEESGGVVSPLAGSLYRIIARLLTQGMVEEARPNADTEPHPGRERKYYALTSAGRLAVQEEASRLRQAADLAVQRLGLTETGRP